MFVQFFVAMSAVNFFLIIVKLLAVWDTTIPSLSTILFISPFDPSFKGVQQITDV